MLILEPAPPPVVSAAMTANRSMAVHTSLLMLPETFTREQLYTKIAALSYQGENYVCIQLSLYYAVGKEPLIIRYSAKKR